VSYVDRWLPEENAELFPELSEPTFPRPDYVVNLDADGLSAFGNESQDFVIASHIIEHLANPLSMLEDIYRVVRPRGLLILILPDRHVTFDRERKPTSLAHLRDEYRRQVREVDDDHLIDFILATVPDRSEASDISPGELEWHRRRSIHAHVWDHDEFCEVLDYADAAMGIGWRKIASLSTGDEGSAGNEFGWVLRRRRRHGRSASAQSTNQLR
jgi:SAM-dependent methyltransferase